MLRLNARLATVLAATLLLAACETSEGYRQQLDQWTGRAGDDLIIAWGAPARRTQLSDGRAVWEYDRRETVRSDGYWRDEQRKVTRTVKDKDGKERQETITEVFPVWQPPSSRETACTTRFVLNPALRIEQTTFEGDACVAPERTG